MRRFASFLGSFLWPFLFLLLALPALADDPITEAQNAFVKGEYQKAIDLAKPQVAVNPDRAWRVIGASKCFLKDKAGAKEAYGKLEAKGQAFIKYVCSRNDVTVP